MSKVDKVLAPVIPADEKNTNGDSADIRAALDACQFLRTTAIEVNKVEHKFASHSAQHKAIAKVTSAKSLAKVEKLAQKLQNEIKLACIEISDDIASKRK